MQIAILSGSHRVESQSAKVARYIADVVRELDPAAEAVVHDLGADPLPLWDTDVWSAPEKHEPRWGALGRALEACDAVVVVAPEWNGMVPPALKNVFLFVGHRLAHKPGLIVAVSSSRGGAYPVVELRASSYKNTRVCYIPEHVIVRDVNHVLNPGEPASRDDVYLRGRVRYAVNLLLVYAEALTRVRDTRGAIDHERYPNGM